MATRRGKGDIRARFYMTPAPETVAGALGRFANELQDWTPVWPRFVREVMILGIAANVESKGARLGATWPLPNARYVRRKRNDGFGVRDLVRTGGMIGELSSVRGIIRMRKTSVSFGTRARQARAVNFGFVHGKQSKRYGRVQIRPRLFMGWTADMRERGTRLLNERIASLMEQASWEMSG